MTSLLLAPPSIQVTSFGHIISTFHIVLRMSVKVFPLSPRHTADAISKPWRSLAVSYYQQSWVAGEPAGAAAISLSAPGRWAPESGAITQSHFLHLKVLLLLVAFNTVLSLLSINYILIFTKCLRVSLPTRPSYPSTLSQSDSFPWAIKPKFQNHFLTERRETTGTQHWSPEKWAHLISATQILELSQVQASWSLLIQLLLLCAPSFLFTKFLFLPK